MLTKIAWVVGALVIVAVVTAVAVVPRLNMPLWSPDPKPANVPDDAVPIPYIAKARLWAKSQVEGTDTRCRIFNSAAIVPERGGPDHLWPKNGDILLPRTNYQEHRRNVEKLGGRPADHRRFRIRRYAT